MGILTAIIISLIISAIMNITLSSGKNDDKDKEEVKGLLGKLAEMEKVIKYQDEKIGVLQTFSIKPGEPSTFEVYRTEMPIIKAAFTADKGYEITVVREVFAPSKDEKTPGKLEIKIRKVA